MKRHNFFGTIFDEKPMQVKMLPEGNGLNYLLYVHL